MSGMNAFISYSHQDSQMLDILHKHLVQLQRDETITAWTDRKILAGGNFAEDISSSLENSQIFLALLSPDYIASNYCYEQEFKTALNMLNEGRIIIVPIILEACDWQSTPFGKFKALPNDGKPVSAWENKNNAFLDVVQNLRKLANSSDNPIAMQVVGEKPTATSMSRNYKIKKDFDSIQKIQFTQKTYQEVSDYLKRYMEEIIQLDGIKAMALIDNTTSFEGLIVNRNKIDTEARLKMTIEPDQQNSGYSRMNESELNYIITKQNNRGASKSFTLAFDEYHLFWTQPDNFYNTRDKKEATSKEIAELIWNEWLGTVGIME